jgi:hypothetical protein
VVFRSFIVGAVYGIASALLAGILGPLSRQPPTLTNILMWWLTGTLYCLSLAPFVLRSAWSRRDTTLAAWAVMLFIRSLGLGIEGALFKPTEAAAIILGAACGVAVSLLVAWLEVMLLSPAQSEPLAQPAPRPWWGWGWRVLLVGLAYFVFYFVFGAANAMLYTRPFYENNPDYGLALPPTGVIFAAQLVRGPLFGLGALFVARAAAMPRRPTAIWLGLLLFVVGGLGPYLETTFRTMPLGFNLATLTEVFLQNFLTGVVAASLYAPAPPAGHVGMAAAT